MFSSFIDATVIRRYRDGRADGLSATAAYRHAITPAPTCSYEFHGDGTVGFLLDDPELEGLVVTATATPDDDPDRSWLGEYTNSWSPGVVARDHAAPAACPRYFLPCYSIAQRRADLSARGYARGPAQVIAERQVREDARLFTELDAGVVTVSVHKAGVLLTQACIGADFDPNLDFEDQLADFATDLLDEAIGEARAALPHQITAPTNGPEPGRQPSAIRSSDSSTTGTAIVVADAPWGCLRTEQADSGLTVLHIDPAAPDAGVRVFLGGAELFTDRINCHDIEVTVYRGERDDRCVVHIDTFDHTGPIRINLNDGPAIYHGDPATGERFTEYTDF